jgi:hypothetical protein
VAYGQKGTHAATTGRHRLVSRWLAKVSTVALSELASAQLPKQCLLLKSCAVWLFLLNSLCIISECETNQA